jgi:hypothetical protein
VCGGGGTRDRHAAAGEAGAAKLATRAGSSDPKPVSTNDTFRRRACLACRAGFAGRDMPHVLATERHDARAPRPKTQTWVGYLTAGGRAISSSPQSMQ